MSERAQSSVSPLSPVVIIGGAGGFGRLFTQLFAKAGSDVVTVDLAGEVDLHLDAATVEAAPELDRALAAARVVLLCLPESAAVTVLEALDRRLPAKAAPLVVDICSVKHRIAEAAGRLCLQCDYVSVHPMFGPERDLPGSNLVFMPVRGSERVAALLAQLRAWQLNVIETDTETHDRVTSLVQVLAHAVLATFANARDRFELSEALVQAFATPVFNDLDKVSQGMVAENPELYHNIQTSNPWGADARDKLRHALQETLATLGDDDPQGTVALFERVRR